MKRHALFVGVDTYADGHIPNLSCAVSDATDLHGFFKYGAGYDRVELLPNPAGKKDVLGLVRELTSDLNSGDFFLFFFAGHGFRVGENHVLVCAKDLYEDVKYADDGLPLGQLKRHLSGAFDSALLLDACQSDILASRGGEGIAERDLSLIHEAPSVRVGGGTLTIVTSCDAGQTAAELSEGRHGLFTMAMLNLLKEAQRTHARLDLSDAFRMNLGRCMGEIAANAGFRTEQRPRFSCTGDSCFVLLDGIASVPAVQAALPMSALPHAAAPASAGECEEEGVAFVEKSTKLRGVMQFDSGYLSKYFITDRKPMECELEDPYILILDGGISDVQAMRSFMTGVEKTGRPLLVVAEDVGDEVLKMLVEKKLRGACCVCAVRAPEDCRTEFLEDVAVVTGGKFFSKDLNIRLQDIQIEWLGRAKKVVVARDGTIVIGGRGSPQSIKERVEMIKWQIDEAVSGDDRDRLRERISKFSCEEYGAAQRLYIQAEKYYRGQNFAKAFEFYQKAAKKGEAEASYSLGRMFEKGEGAAKNNEKALFWYRRAAELGSENALGVIKEQEDRLKEELEEKALQDGADAQYNLGARFYDGDGVKINYQEAFKWYRMAAEHGHADAQCKRGEMYYYGEGMEKDSEEALAWYLRAAVQGQEDAHEALRENLQELFESEDDAETAEKWCSAVVDRGNEDEIEIVNEIKAEIEEGLKRDQQSEDAATEWVPRDEEKRKSWDFIREAAAGIEGSNAFPHVLLGDDCLVDYAISSDTAALLLEVLPYSCDYGVVDEDASPASDEVSLAFVAKLMKAKASLNKQSDAHVSIGVFASQATIQDIRSMVADSKFKDVHLEYLTCANFTDRVKRLLSCQQSDVQDEQQENDFDTLNEKAANYYHGLNGVKEDRARAAELYKKAAALGDVSAQTILGVCYYNGDGVAQDYAEAAQWWRKAAEQGFAQAQWYLGSIYHHGKGVARNSVEAAKWYRKAAGQGIAEAQYNLGVCYKDGDGIDQDEVEGVKWIRKAAEQGFAQAQVSLGACYKHGVGVSQDNDEAIRWLRKAAEQDEVKAQVLLAGCYFEESVNGKDVGQNLIDAEKWARKAADQGDEDAIKLLPLLTKQLEISRQLTNSQTRLQDTVQNVYEQAENYYRGQNGVKEDRAKAFELYQRAAEQGHAESQYSLGYMYAYGEGVAKNNDKALFWYEKAAAQGHQKAARFLSGLKERIVKEQEEERARAYWERKEEERRLNGAQARQEITQRERDAQFRVEKERQDTKEKMSQAYKSYEGGNYSAAALLWRICAVRGVAAAQHNLGALYATGKGVEQDYAQAIEWLQKGAAQGDEDSQKLLDTIKLRLHQGRQRLQDEKERLQSEKERLLNEKRRLEQQNASELEERRRLLQEQGRLLNSLGVRFYNGTHGQRQDYVKAVEHFKKAAEIGNASAQFNLGVCYASGAGVAKNVREAIRWYRKAAENGHDKAKEELRELGEM